MLLSVIIVSYNTKDLTINTVESVVNSTAKSKLLKDKLEIVVVDNASTDGSVKALKRLKTKLKIPLVVVANKENLGFGKANNLGVTKAKGEYYLFLNSDTIVKGSALETMVKRFLKNENLGILAASLLNLDSSYQPQGGSFPNLLNLFLQMSMLDDLPVVGKYLPSTQRTGKANYLDLETLKQTEEIIEFDWVGGTAMMISKKAFDTFAGFDPNIFMYSEDIEICLRARNHNFIVAMDPKARIIHLQNASSSSANALKGEFKGYLYIFAKHHSSFQTSLAKIILQLGAILRIIVFSSIAKNKAKVKIYKSILSELS